MEGAAARDNIGDPALFLEPVDGFLGQAAVDGHEVNPFLGLGFDGSEKVVLGHVDDGAAAVDGFDGSLVDGDCSQGDGGVGEDAAADRAEVAACAQVHEGVGFVPEGYVDFAELVGEAGEVGRCPEVNIDLGAEGAADADGAGEGGVVGVAGDDHLALGDQFKERLGGNFLIPGHFFHGPGENAFASLF